MCDDDYRGADYDNDRTWHHHHLNAFDRHHYHDGVHYDFSGFGGFHDHDDHPACDDDECRSRVIDDQSRSWHAQHFTPDGPR